MAAIDLSLDTTPWMTALDQLGKRGAIAIARGINRTAASERTAMARAIAADMGVKVSTARDAIKVEKASASTMEGRVVARGKRLPLIVFKARGPLPTRGRGNGVTYNIRGHRKTIQQAFLATTTVQSDGTGGEHRGVFIRASQLARISKGGWGKNLPIKQLYGPSIARVFANLLPVGEARRTEVLAKNVQHEIEFELSRLKA